MGQPNLRKAWESGDIEAIDEAIQHFTDAWQDELLAVANVPANDQAGHRNWLMRFAKWLFSTDHIQISYSIDYEGTDITKLSPGSRGIVLLLLYLALDESDHSPLIIDQPEENLDPKSIFDELVSLFVAAIRRQIRDAERDIAHATRRVSEIGQDIARFVPTAGEAFAMTVNGTLFSERKAAGRALMKEILTLVHNQQVGEIVLASIGGFDLLHDGERFDRGEGYRYDTVLRRTGFDHEIELPLTVTPLGAISRLEHALEGFHDEREGCRHGLADAERRLASYRSREGGVFAFADELAQKRRQLAEVEAALSADAVGHPSDALQAA